VLAGSVDEVFDGAAGSVETLLSLAARVESDAVDTVAGTEGDFRLVLRLGVG
jgi:hypothetical protein